MRLGNSKSASYRRAHANKYRRRQIAVKKLCCRLDKLVARAESFRKGKTRESLFKQADKVRDKLRALDH
jgi:hypothetical protein